MSLNTESLDQRRLTRLLAAIALVLAPHALHLPPWLSLTVGALIAWRWGSARHGWPLPGRWLRTVLTLGAFAAVFVTYGRSSGQVAGTALLCLLIGLKLTELEDRRGATVLLLLLYFTLFTHFLRDQAIWTVAWMIAAVWLVTALLIDGQRQTPRPAREDLSMAGRVLLLALPVMLLLWILFPRIPGPLWGAPVNQGVGRTGIDERMAPGDIAELIQSDAVAFRVRFDDNAPAKPERYWRGPVLWYTDGREWRPQAAARARPRQGEPPAVDIAGPAFDYELTIEPHQLEYIFALDHAAPGTLPEKLSRNADGAVVAEQNIRNRSAYRLRSYPEARLGQTLDESARRRALQLPAEANPRTRALAERWRIQNPDPMQIAGRALERFRQEEFFYTLSPPPLGANSFDAFLFETQRGFCEHYAGSFATLMRAAGVPARVVLGYQGGSTAQVGDYLIVRQSDAHAWVEIWVRQRGWVRIDPTAAVAPNRVEQNLDSALAEAGESRAFSWQRSLEIGRWVTARWDFLNAQWNRWVLAYGPELQRALLSRVGLGDWQRMLLALTGLLALLMGAIALLVVRDALADHHTDPLQREWLRILARLGRSGLPAQPAEGPRDYVQRIRPQLPVSAQRALNDAADAYLRARYQAVTSAERDALASRVRDARHRLPPLVLRPAMAAAHRRFSARFASRGSVRRP
ncbi:transglutaminase TgpA family protein [Algiphilus aromaticivorans]|uniref:transglutaminase TgpA family protein n=1 Tax=Algiphilus aromaticivorans TaxID=382454 RepID=UPI000695001E|nr:DUF3488 and transglutaminase-like domain-containing protein [Algiphilus aromaticivorans]